MTVMREPDDAATAEGTPLGDFLADLSARGHRFDAFDDLWRWSVTDLDGFWGAVRDHFGVDGLADEVLARERMPGARWFPGSAINYAAHMLGGAEDADRTAVIAYSQTREKVELTFGELADAVARCRAGLMRLGVGRDDRVVGFLPNVPEALVAFLACASLGAVWASCAPEFGARSVIDRFAQIEPSVLLTVGGYVYGDKPIDKSDDVAAIRAGLPTVRHVVGIPYGRYAVPDGALTWEDLLAEAGDLTFEPVPFDHALSVLFSSGTTGLPKAIVHGHGGILLEHLKNGALALDLRAGDRFLWFTTTAWTMWNILVSGLLLRAAVVLVDGNFLYPDLGEQWRIAADAGVTTLGTSPAYLMACRKAGIVPRDHDLSALRMLGITGSPLPGEGFDWAAEELGPGVLVNSLSGGTDVCSGFVGGGPWLPVYRGELSGPMLGVDVTVFDEAGHEVVGQVGELVIRRPMPSMPVRFWNDPDDARYRESYFEDFPGVWRHGDWAVRTDHGGFVITGRSDATLNRGGVRLGTAEFYAVVEDLPEVADSLVVHLEDGEGGPGRLLLFVVPVEGQGLDDDLRGRIRSALRRELSPRHVPDAIEAVPAVPRTLTGKKLERPVKQILAGRGVDEVASRGAVDVPDALDAFVAWQQGSS